MTMERISLISTIREKCRMCYTCVRNCPAKAIRVEEGQASIVDDRCIACGNCIRVCSREAKRVHDSTGEIRELLASGARVAAIVAPSFPAEFAEFSTGRFIGALRELGFAAVNEVSFGADLVAHEYARLLAETQGSYISTTCPAVVSMVEKYHPELVPQLAPVVSPMVATARVVRERLGAEVQVVFIGPCVAKKGEAINEGHREDVQAALTFAELRRLFEERGIAAGQGAVADFDPPQGGLGSLFPISRGLLQAAGLQEDLMSGEIVVAEGKSSLEEALSEFGKESRAGVRLLDILACNGCINGAGFSREDSVYERRRRVSEYTREKLKSLDQSVWKAQIEEYSRLPIESSYRPTEERAGGISDEDLNAILARMGKNRVQDELNCGACGYATCRQHATAIHHGLAEVEMCLPYTIESLRKTVTQLEDTNKNLTTVREALIQSEKLASMGQLAAGVAHEVNNPLGVVLLYANILLEEAAGNEQDKDDLKTIVDAANRCKRIVSQLLDFARQNKVFRSPVSPRGLMGAALKAAVPPANVMVVLDHRGEDVPAELDPDQMLQVLINLVSNACAAMPEGGRLTLRTVYGEGNVTFAIEDTGIGIPKENLKKVFVPFFSTKQVGKGTGLGLAVSHGIVKMHRGQIQVDSNADPAAGPTGTVFKVTVPLKEAQGA